MQLGDLSAWRSGSTAFGVNLMVLKALTALELARIAAGPPRPDPNDLIGSRKERTQYDGLVRRQRKLASQTVEPQEPLRSSTRFEQKKLFVSDEWLLKEHPAIGRVEAGTPVASSPWHVRRRMCGGDACAATTRTPALPAAASMSRPKWWRTQILSQRRVCRSEGGAPTARAGEQRTRLKPSHARASSPAAFSSPASRFLPAMPLHPMLRPM